MLWRENVWVEQSRVLRRLRQIIVSLGFSWRFRLEVG